METVSTYTDPKEIRRDGREPQKIHLVLQEDSSSDQLFLVDLNYTGASALQWRTDNGLDGLLMV